MRDRDLYAKILNLPEPWIVVEVELDLKEQSVQVRLGRRDGAPLECPECGQTCPGYDTQPRRWRHLDTCQFHSVLEADVPRCSCSVHGVKQVRVPWAEPGSRFTALFERLAIDWMQEAGRSATARQLGLTWSEADGIMQRAVDRGLARRPATLTSVLGVDEKSFQGREFVTVVCDLDGGTVLHVADGRGSDALKSCYEAMTNEQRAAVKAVAMDMHQPYVLATRSALPDATIVFDKFHIAQLAGFSFHDRLCLLTRVGYTTDNLMPKQKLELTWIGKDQRPKLGPRILLEDPAKSYHAAQRVSESDLFDNRLIFGRGSGRESFRLSR